MTTWRVPPHVTDSSIKGQEHPAFVGGSSDDHWVGLAGQLLLNHRVDVMTVVSQRLCEVVGKILVEFESHAGNE